MFSNYNTGLNVFRSRWHRKSYLANQVSESGCLPSWKQTLCQEGEAEMSVSLQKNCSTHALTWVA
jgi:hypothetical protein